MGGAIPPDSKQSAEAAASPADVWLPFGFGVVAFVVVLVLAIVFEHPNPFLLVVLRTLLALASGGIAAAIPGLFHFRTRGPRHFVQASSGLAVFAYVFSVNPAPILTDALHRGSNDGAEAIATLTPTPTEADSTMYLPAGQYVLGKDYDLDGFAGVVNVSGNVVLRSSQAGTRATDQSGFAGQGRAGASGSNGADGEPGSDGAVGDSGNAGTAIRLAFTKLEGVGTLTVINGGQDGGNGQKGGPGGPGGNGAKGRNRGGDAFCTNDVSPGNGGRGGNGGPGGRGGKGGDGGPGGDITYVDALKRYVESGRLVLLAPGGKGGRGGDGGVGGPAGVPGEGGDRSHCGGGADRGPAGSPGGEGGRGEVGQDGSSGRIRTLPNSR